MVCLEGFIFVGSFAVAFDITPVNAVAIMGIVYHLVPLLILVVVCVRLCGSPWACWRNGTSHASISRQVCGAFSLYLLFMGHLNI